MRSNSTELATEEVQTLMRCRLLVEERDRLKENVRLAAYADLQGVLSEDGIRSHTARLQHQEERIKALEREIEPARAKAQQVADRIVNTPFRRFCELYCIDGAEIYAAGMLCGRGERTINRYAALLNEHRTGGNHGE